MRRPLAAFLRPPAAAFFLPVFFLVAFFLAAFFVAAFFFPAFRTAFFLAAFFAVRFVIFLRGAGLFFVVRFFEAFVAPMLPPLRLTFALAFRVAAFLAAICNFPRELTCKHHFRLCLSPRIVREKSEEIQPGQCGKFTCISISTFPSASSKASLTLITEALPSI